MSLSRPVRFPFLKLPWLSIKCVLHNLDAFIIIYFATISNRTRRMVRSSNYPIKVIDVSGRSSCSRMSIKDQLGDEDNEKTWFFKHGTDAYDGEFVLQMGSQPIRTCRHFDTWGDHYLHSYTDGDSLDAMKIGIEFMIDVFGCTIGCVTVDGNKLSQPSELGISSVEVLFIMGSQPVNITDLKYLLQTIKVTDSYAFYVPIPANFFCDPQIFKCRRLDFPWRGSADWVTLELICQFDVPRLNFLFHRFSFEDIVSYITHWSNSEKRKLEYVKFGFKNPISLAEFNIDNLNPMPFCEKRRNRCPFFGGWKGKDMSSGRDILRKDGLLATFYVESKSVIFYIWHKRFPDAVQT